MPEEKSKEVLKEGKNLICPVCGHDRFWRRKSLMSTKGATLWGFDWANPNAVNYICDRCGYIFWFIERTP